MAYRTTERFTVGDSYCLGASFPNYVPLPPVPSLSKRNLFAIFVLYGPIYDVAGDLHFPQRTGLWPRGNSRVAASENLRATALASLR